MSETKLCRLCVKVCTDYASLYNETGQKNNIYERTLKYFDPMFLNADHVPGTPVLCLECCGHISVFYNFQQTVFQAQRRLLEGEKEIEFEFKKQMSEELILDNLNNSCVTVKQDDSISLPDLELVEEFMFTDILPNEDNRVNSQTVIEPIPQCEQTEEDTEQSKDQPLSTYDTSELEKGSNSEDNQPTIERKLKQKQNADEPIPTCENTEEFGNKDDTVTINNFDTEQSKDQPISTSDTSEKGSDSDGNQPTTTIKRKLRRSQRSAPKDLDAVIAQRKPSLECAICKESLANFKSFREHFRLEHPNEPIPTCGNTEEQGDKNDKLIINNFETEQTKDQPISTTDTRKGNHSDYIHPRTTMKRKRKRKLRSTPKVLDAIIAQWKPSLECVVCKKSVANFLSLSLHFRHEHPKEKCRVECCSCRFYGRSTVAEHARLHFNPDKVKCKLCDSYFASINCMHVHMRRVHLTTNMETSDTIGNLKLRSKSMQRKQNAAHPISTCENAEEFGDNNDNNFDTEQSKDQPISTSDTSEKGCDSDGNQPTTTIKRKLRRSQRSAPKDLDSVIAQRKPSLECAICKESLANFKSFREHFRLEHPNEPIPTCGNTEELGDKNDKIIINSFDTEQSKDQPISTSDTSESEKGSDSDYIRPRTTMKRKRKPKLRSAPKVLDAVIAQWKSSLECVVCKKSVANFLSLSLHFRHEHPNERCRVECCSCRFYGRSTVAEHARLHFNPDKVKCKLCDSYFASINCMHVHMRRLHITANIETSDTIGNSKLRSKSIQRKQNADQPIPTCENTEEFGDKNDNNFDNEQSKDQPISTSDTSVKGCDSDGNQPTTTIKRRLRRSQRSARKDLDSVIAQRKPSLECAICKESLANFKSFREHFRLEHPNDPIPTCGNTEELGDKNDKIIINNFDTEQSKDQPISTSDTSESEKGSDSDYIRPRTTMKRKRKPKLRSAPKDLDDVIAQWKPRLECVVCKKSVANFLSLSLHFRNEHPNERCHVECCSRKFYHRWTLVDHARLHFNPDKVKCKLCDSYFTSINRMHVHMRHVHFTANIETSATIGNSKLGSKSMQRKRKQNADQPIPTCENTEEFGDKNDNNFDTEQSKDQPLSTSDTSEKGSDSDDNQPTTTIGRKRKQRSVPKDLDAVIAQWKPSLECVVCKKSVANFLSLTLHFRNKHPNERCRVECCSRKFYHRWTLVDHARLHFNPDKVKCKLCNSYFASVNGVHVHMRSVHFSVNREISHKIGNSKLRSKSSIKCVICKTSFAEFSLLKAHYRQDHPTEVCYALCCERKFYKPHQIEEHMQLHRDPDAFKCEVCDKRLRTSIALRGHMRLHRDPNAFTCNICGKSLCTSTVLKQHMRNHLDPKSFECEICGKRLGRSDVLKEHMLVHHDYHSLKCEICGKSLYRSDYLREHMQRHRDPNAFKCEICGNRLSCSKALKKHMRQYHSNIKTADP